MKRVSSGMNRWYPFWYSPVYTFLTYIGLNRHFLNPWPLWTYCVVKSVNAVFKLFIKWSFHVTLGWYECWIDTSSSFVKYENITFCICAHREFQLLFWFCFLCSFLYDRLRDVWSHHQLKSVSCPWGLFGNFPLPTLGFPNTMLSGVNTTRNHD